MANLPKSDNVLKMAAKVETKFITGSLVALKSGGPSLTVRFYMPPPNKTQQQGSVVVDWFIDGESYEKTFLEDQLYLVEDKQEEQEDEEMDIVFTLDDGLNISNT